MNSEAFMAGFDDGLDKLARGRYVKRAKAFAGRMERKVVGAKTQDVPTKELAKKLVTGKGSKSAKMIEKGRSGRGKGWKEREYEELGRGKAAKALALRIGVPTAAAGTGALGLGALLRSKKKD